MMKERVLEKKVKIDQESIREFYTKRAVQKSKIDVDLPVVLCADKNVEKVEYWNEYEIKERLPLFKLDRDSRVLELGCGTGRISKYITSTASYYVGIDYVKDFIELIKRREDVVKTDRTYFLHTSLQDFVSGAADLPRAEKFNRFMLAGGVFMYINDEILKPSIEKLVDMFDEHCLIYISEPIALEKRLTLDQFYSDNLESKYSAIYRTIDEYNELFAPFYKNGFKMTLEESFFKEDIKNQKETRQWLFILER